MSIVIKGQTVYGSRSIVSENLMMYLDAANKLSYSGTGTSWNDISFYKNVATLVNGPSFSSLNFGSIAFDGTDDLVSFPTKSFWNLSSSNFTIEFWFKLNSITNNNPRLFKTSNDGNTAGISIVNPPSSNNLLIYMSSNGSTYNILNGAGLGSVTLGQFNHLVITRSGSTLSIYINNSFASSANIGTTSIYYNSATDLALGGTVGGGRSILGNIAVFKLYSKELTATQVSQNYNALKNRFGL
jgi:hypothetical protein